MQPILLSASRIPKMQTKKKRIGMAAAVILLPLFAFFMPLKANASDVVQGEPITEAKLPVSRQEVLLPSIGLESVLDAGTSDEEIRNRSVSEEFFGYKNLGIANVDSNLNIRKEPKEGASLTGKLPKNCACEILDQTGDWSHIKSGKAEGYVKTEFLFTGSEARAKAIALVKTVAKIGGDAVRVRREPSLEAGIYTLVGKGESLEYSRTVDDMWVEVLLDDETVYVASEYVTIEDELATGVTISQILYGGEVSNVRINLCEYAKQFVGNPYVYGGASLTKGTDCSGFTMSVFKKFGISLPHNSGAQSKMGTAIKLADAKPGDLVFYGGSGGINHVAIYIGGGQVVHASNPSTGIRISAVGYRSPVKIVRIIKG